MLRISNLTHDITVDDTSVIVKDFDGSFPLPKGDPALKQLFDGYWPRHARALETERFMLNAHSSFWYATNSYS